MSETAQDRTIVTMTD